MGNRSNIAINFGDWRNVYLYGHWMGEDSIAIVRGVLARRQRWNDAPYLARMIFSEMVGGNVQELRSDLGYGISPWILDNEWPVIHVNCETQTLRIKDYDDIETLSECTFEQFIETTECTFETLIHTLNTM